MQLPSEIYPRVSIASCEISHQEHLYIGYTQYTLGSSALLQGHFLFSGSRWNMQTVTVATCGKTGLAYLLNTRFCYLKTGGNHLASNQKIIQVCVAYVLIGIQNSGACFKTHICTCIRVDIQLCPELHSQALQVSINNSFVAGGKHMILLRYPEALAD